MVLTVDMVACLSDWMLLEVLVHAGFFLSVGVLPPQDHYYHYRSHSTTSDPAMIGQESVGRRRLLDDSDGSLVDTDESSQARGELVRDEDAPPSFPRTAGRDRMASEDPVPDPGPVPTPSMTPIAPFGGRSLRRSADHLALRGPSRARALLCH